MRASFTIRLVLLLFVCACTFGHNAYAQSDSSRIEIRNADYLEIIQKRNVSINRLMHNVVLVQRNLTLYCDSALLFKTENIAKIYGHVHLNQADSVHVYGDSAIYDGNTRMARIYGNVRLTDNSMTLTTNDLRYDMNTRIATYVNGGKVTDGEAVLTSELGYYFAQSNDAFFRNEVLLTHPKYTLEADTLQYNTAQEKAYFHGPTIIKNAESTVYCNKGFYETNSGIAVFHESVRLDNPPQQLIADSIYYNRETGIGKAFGNIAFRDTAQQVLQYSHIAEYDEIRNTIFSTSGSIAGYIMDTDTLFIGGDTIRTGQDSMGLRTMQVFRNVRIYKSDLQGLCDSLSYSDADSTLRMYGLPVMWSDSTQFTADTIHMLMRNKQLREVQLYSNGFIINEDDSLIYNQIKGRNIYGYFSDNDLKKIHAAGNGESVYFGKDEAGRYIGVNKLFCSEIDIYLNDRKFHRIAFRNAPDSSFTPMEDIRLNEYQLRNFSWKYDERPRSMEDLR